MRVDIQTDRSSPIVRRAIAGQPEGRSAVRSENILVFEENKVCITSMKCCLFCKNCEEKIDLEASRCFERKLKASEAGSKDVVDGLADWKRRRSRT